VGINAVVMDNVMVGGGSIIGALCFVPEGMQIPERKVVVGNPAKIIKDVSDEMLDWKAQGTELYQKLPEEMKKLWKECKPLHQIPPGRKKHAQSYKPWKKTKA